MALLWLLLLGPAPLLLVLSSWPPSAGFLQVEMARETQTVFLNDNVTIVCKVPSDSPLNITLMGVTWFRKHHMSTTEVTVFQYFGGNRMITRPGASVSLSKLERGDASLKLPDIRLEEAGEYRCEVVMTPNKAVKTIQLEIVAYPVPSLFPEQAIMKENEEQLISCMASRFYPLNITITWKKWTQKDPQYVEVSEGVFTNYTTDNKNVTSFLRLKPSLEDNMTIYQCVIWHKSLPTYQRLNFTLTVIESEKTESEKTAFTLKYVVFPCLGIAFVIVLLIVLWKWVPSGRYSLFSVLKACSQNTQIDTRRNNVFVAYSNGVTTERTLEVLTQKQQ
ncbi:natural cytotoxicity triggering receptor 3 ligand 1 isoform X1 [Mustela putorius furo]|uniref:Natural cytotoxicity triggering receptor 3 ligand 1 isoform X1 n=1 Tax=Mustela putorius furo TaxID=9669 RepID=M3YPK4_MUSPF|nr:natural cytotoxicity triggering receptor 3 ligand 1 isoform X1 [Mustela putorius furo]